MRSTKAASLTEYAIILALVGVVTIAAVLGLGVDLRGVYGDAASDVQNARAEAEALRTETNGGGNGNGQQPTPGDPLIFSVETDTGAMRLSLTHKTAAPVVTVDWGGASNCPATVTGQENIVCAYATPGTYTVQITGEIDNFTVNQGYSFINDAAPDWDIWKTETATGLPPDDPAAFQDVRIVSVQDWGDSNLRDLGMTFAYAMEPYTVPAQLPASVEHLSSTFFASSWISPTVAGWDTSNVRTMIYTFASVGRFFPDAFGQPTAPDLLGWDVSNVVNFRGMFNESPGFNQDISNWDVSSGVTFYEMFTKATAFQVDISGWNMGGAFAVAPKRPI